MSRRHAASELHRQIDRYWHTVRYLRPAQIVARADLRARAAARMAAPRTTRRRYSTLAARAGLEYSPDPWQLRGTAAKARRWIAPGAAASLEQDAADMVNGVFTFLNDRRRVGRPVDWSAAGASQLWRYHLHYFDYLPDLLVAGRASEAMALTTDWVERVPMGDGSARDAWHPYVVSLRLVNWMLFLAAAPQDAAPPHSVLESLRIQTVFIERNREKDVGGNHLLKNLKALVAAGCFWRGDRAAVLRERFTREFVEALRRQLRSDGGHYEQSPMYHAQVLGDAIEIAMLLRRSATASAALEALIEPMTDFLQCIRHPDGGLVQFGDTAAGMAPEPAALIEAAGVLRHREPVRALAPRHALLASAVLNDARLQSFETTSIETVTGSTRTQLADAWDPKASGFVTLATAAAPGFLMADAGPVCPDDLPAHAHADLFGFEVSVDRTRMIVDSGVSEYAAGPWREYFRSTRAHSTVMVDGIEQSECWSSFRVARRARIAEPRVIRRRNIRGFSAAHTGFDHLSPPVRHRRHFLVVGERCWLLVDDLRGDGVHKWTTFLHFHPDVLLSRCGDTGLLATCAGATLGIGWFGISAPLCVAGARDPLQGWYAPAFGQVFPSPTLLTEGCGELPVRFGWLLVPAHSADQPLHVETPAADRLVVQAGGETYDITLDAQ